ncbi:hypothetical protein H2200_011536 [Cladophialophora chaetospira]|uniref:Uncharacterized protein n=1 Tax=Cladophialophora chaetospira TaxID=386627 RepID=A0AA38WZI7_9EURO|nr:hypothetical protein H2200_011536 [Cladophialophora chaetospira]
MAQAVSSEQISDDELVELELEQRQLDLDRELKQRQLDLDLKKVKLQKRRAKLHPTVDLTSDDHPTEVKAEPEDQVSPNEPAGLTVNPLPSPAPSEAAKSSYAKSTSKEPQESHGVLPDYDHDEGFPDLWQDIGRFQGLPEDSILKRSQSPASRVSAGFGNKRQKTSTGTREQIPDPKTKDKTEVPKINKREKTAIIRRYGERLVQHHMQSFRKHTPAEREEVRKVADKIVDGLLEKRFKNVEELHNEYKDQIGKSCRYVLRARLVVELDKFCRAAPVWWGECLARKNRIQREEFIMTIFQDVKEGKYDIGRTLQSKSPASKILPS